MGNEKQIILEGIERFLNDVPDVAMGIHFYPLSSTNKEYNVYFTKLNGSRQPSTLAHAKSTDLVDAMRSAYNSARVMYELKK